MNLIRLDTAASLELIGRYATAEDKVLQYRRELTPLFVKAQQHLGQVPLTLAWLDIAHANLRRSRGDLILRREWFIRADSAAAGAYEGWQELAPLSANKRSWQDLGSLLSSHEDLSDEELSSLLEEIAARSLVFPTMAADLLAQLGPDGFASIAERTMLKLERHLFVSDQTPALALLRGLSMLVANASHAPAGIPQELEDYLMPTEGTHDDRHRVRHLGMLVAGGSFHSAFASRASLFLLSKQNREVVTAAHHNHPLRKGGRAQQPYAPLLNPLVNSTESAKTSPHASLQMLSEIVASPEGIVDVDTYMIHGESPEVIVDGLTDSIVNAAVEDPYLREQAWPAFLKLLEWLPENDSTWQPHSPAWSSIARFAGLYWPELRNVATSVTSHAFARILASPEAMSVMSLSVGAFALGHLSDAIEVELDESLDDTQRDRRISAHVDAVSDAYHHVFAAAVNVSEQKQKKTMSLLASGLNFLDRRLMRVMLVGGLTPVQKAVATVAATGIRKARESVTESLEASAPQGDVSPKSIFANQIMNRDRAAVGGHAPMPTWFELELANKLLEHKPELAASIEAGGVEAGGTAAGGTAAGSTASGNTASSRWLSENRIQQSDDPAFAQWFTEVVNADPPTEFSLAFVHLQREFAHDLLLDATSVELDAVWEQTQEAVALSRQTAEEWQEWQEEWEEEIG